jgi:NAD(P)-dependent dehydrogenase (short-subunit alcohol dehydrogenase family)
VAIVTGVSSGPGAAFARALAEAGAAGYLESQLPRVPVGRLGHPQELAAALVFPVSGAGGYVPGTTLPVEGGMLTS